MIAAAAPTVSVIVPTYNSEAHVGALLESLAAQTWQRFELIVSDGASSDATLRIVERYAPRLPRLRIDSRPDQGVYDAINRGLCIAEGEWVIVLGSDDRLHAEDTLAQATPLLAASQADLVYGDVRMNAPNRDGVPPGGRYAGALSLDQLLTRNICQQSIFYRRAVFAAIGTFDTRYRLWADWDFNLRAAFRTRLEWIDLVVADYAASGMSSSRSDALYQAEAPDRLRRELLQRPFERRLWPLQRWLLRQFDSQRRRGRLRSAARLLASYCWLRALRVAAPWIGR